MRRSPTPAQTVLPRWRGFKLLEMFTTQQRGVFREDDFRWIADWGFDFVRLPMSHRWWVIGSDPDHPLHVTPRGLEPIDRAIEWGERYGIHVCKTAFPGSPVPLFCVPLFLSVSLPGRARTRERRTREGNWGTTSPAREGPRGRALRSCGRAHVNHEDWCGHELDRQLLALLKES